MNKKLINDDIEEVLIILLTLDWYLDSFKPKEMGELKILLRFFKKEIKSALNILQRNYFEVSTKDTRVLKKKSKKTKKVVKNATKKTKGKSVSKIKKGPVKNKKSARRVQRKNSKIRK